MSVRGGLELEEVTLSKELSALLRDEYIKTNVSFANLKGRDLEMSERLRSSVEEPTVLMCVAEGIRGRAASGKAQGTALPSRASPSSRRAR